MEEKTNVDSINLEEFLGKEKPSTDVLVESTTKQPSTEGIRSMEQVYEDRKDAGQPVRRPGAVGLVQDLAEGTGRNLYENIAPVVGVADTLIDVINLASADGGRYDIPKLPKYESETTQALRNISGLIIPSLGLRSN